IRVCSLDWDDVWGLCGKGFYPLLNTIAYVLAFNINKQSFGQNIDSLSDLKEKSSKKVLFCSVSSNVKIYYGSRRFTLNKIKLDLCIYLLIDYNNSLFFNINLKIFSNDIIEKVRIIRSKLPNKYLLTISFQIQPNKYFNLIQLNNLVNYIIVLSFDEKSTENFQQIKPWNDLYYINQDNLQYNLTHFSMNSILARSLSYGISKDKLIMSIPTYGQGFPGRITHKKGILVAYEICDLIKQENYRRFFDNKTFLVLAHKKNSLIIYDDIQTLKLKNDIFINGTIEYKSNFIINSQIAGVLVHYIDMDDYIGLSCNRGAYPITSVVSRIFSQSKSSLETKMLNSQSETTITSSIMLNNLCLGVKTNELIEDKTDCRYYYVCQPNNSKPISRLQCPQYMFFSIKEKTCTHQYS
ncbi:unnamed protein product, partial [Rotaria sp. Silwood2]